MNETCKGCDGTGVVSVCGRFAVCNVFDRYTAVRETCVCGECNGTGSVER